MKTAFSIEHLQRLIEVAASSSGRVPKSFSEKHFYNLIKAVAIAVGISNMLNGVDKHSSTAGDLSFLSQHVYDRIAYVTFEEFAVVDHLS